MGKICCRKKMVYNVCNKFHVFRGLLMLLTTYIMNCYIYCISWRSFATHFYLGNQCKIIVPQQQICQTLSWFCVGLCIRHLKAYTVVILSMKYNSLCYKNINISERFCSICHVTSGISINVWLHLVAMFLYKGL